jgi:hypothetical protein
LSTCMARGARRAPVLVLHSPHRLDDDESIMVSTKPGQVQEKRGLTVSLNHRIGGIWGRRVP